MNQQNRPPRKGLGTIAWIAIGCVSVMLMAVVGAGLLTWWGFNKAKNFAEEFEKNPAAAARWIIKKMPDVEEVAVDEENGTITVRYLKTGEEVTVDLDDLKDGRLSFSTDEGEFTFEADDDESGTVTITSEKGNLSFETGEHSTTDFPDWAPQYDDLVIEGQHSLAHDTGASGGYHGLTEHEVPVVVGYFDDQLSRQGFEVKTTSFSAGSGDSVMLTATDDASERTIVVNVTEQDGATKVALTFNKKNKSAQSP